MFRIIRFFVLEAVMLILIISGCVYSDLIVYGLGQAKGQVQLILNTRSIVEVMKDPAFPDSLKRKLELIAEIKKFANDSLGLKHSDNYTTIYDQHGKPALWTITASEPFRLKAKEWFFPFLGAVSYKGFFNYDKGKKEADALAAQGYDVDYGGVSGWSTLGWFRDPVLSSMLNRNEGQLADLIIHELTHGTVYLKSSVDFNENLANFVGDKGAQLFLQRKYGPSSGMYEDYMHSKSDRKIYNAYILDATTRLDSLYKSFKPGDPVSSKEMKKMEFIYATIRGVESLKLFHKHGYMSYTRNALDEKNAFFMSFRRYDSKYEEFEKEFNEVYRGNLRAYIKGIASKQ